MTDPESYTYAQAGVSIDAGNALRIVGDYDLIVDGSDNFPTRYLVSDACFFAHKPLVTGALGTFDFASPAAASSS